MRAANIINDDFIFSRAAPIPETGCFIWMGATTRRGYGVTRLNGATVLAHKAIWEAKNGPVPTGLQLHRQCGSPACVNPAHLLAGVVPAERKNTLTTGIIKEKSSHDEATGCWMWNGIAEHEYGMLRVAGRGQMRAHRLSWEAHNGLIPEGMQVLHKCDTPACVNPYHLFLGDHSDNMADMKSKGRGASVRGEAHHQGKLDDASVIDILTSPKSNTTLAECYHVSKVMVGLIRKRKRWQHVKVPT